MFSRSSGMRKALSVLFIVSMLLVSVAAVSSADTQSARTAKWVVSVTYQNIGTAASPVNVQFYSEGSATPVSFSPGTLAAGAGKSFFIGNVSGLSAGFLGNAVMSAQQPLAATVVQFSQEPGFKMRMLSNGFDSNSTSAQYLVATVLKNKFSRTTVFSVQNTEAVAIDATIKFYDADANGALKSTKEFEIAANSSKFIEMDNADDTGITDDVFNGSAIITAKTKGGADAKVVSAASEYYTDRNVGTNYEGLPLSATANILYMATALCANSNLDTFYAIQNASLTDNASVTITYKKLNGDDQAVDGPYSIGPGQKKSVNTCKPSDGTDMTNFTGAAVVSSTGAAIAAIGKAQNSATAGSDNTADVLTAFLGEKAGATKLALPFVRWANDANFAASTGGQQRTFIAIQNLENTAIDVNVKYNDKNGTTVVTKKLTIAANSKVTTNAKKEGALGQSGMNEGEFGYYTDATFGGAVIIESDAANPNAKFIAIARVQNPGAGEDYNSIHVQ